MTDEADDNEQIVLSMDRATARDLYDELYAVGEHWAAGAEIPYPPSDVMNRLIAVFNDLGHELGIPTMAERMRRYAWSGKAAPPRVMNRTEPRSV
jgi:hypothetical protein